MASIVANAWRLTSKIVRPTGNSAVKKMRGKQIQRKKLQYLVICWSVRCLEMHGRQKVRKKQLEATSTLHMCSTAGVSPRIENWIFQLCAGMSEGSPPWGAGNVRPNHQRVLNFTKSSLNCIQNGRFSRRLLPVTQLLKSRVVPWAPAFLCTSRIPKQRSLDPPIRTQICNMHRKSLMMFEAFS